MASLLDQGVVDALQLRRRIPLGELGWPEDVARVAWFFASPDASYVNGATVYVDGGWTAFGNAGDVGLPHTKAKT